MEWLTDTFNSLLGTTESSAAPEVAAKPSEKLIQKQGGLQSTGTLSKPQLLRFFAAGREQLQSEAFRQRLKDAQFLQQDLEDVVTEAQKKIFEEQGIQGSFGVSYLAKVNVDFKQDDEVMSAFLQFVNLEEDALAEAELTPEMYAQNQRLMELARGHAAEMMEKMKELSPEDQKKFVAQQMQNVDKMRKQGIASAQEGPSQGMSMTAAERAKFFKQMQT